MNGPEIDIDFRVVCFFRHPEVWHFSRVALQATTLCLTKAPGVLLDAQRTLSHFESTHRALRKSGPPFGPMLLRVVHGGGVSGD